jgi:hypothetical protein
MRPERTAVALRVFNVAQDSMYKYRVFAGEVNVARPRSNGADIPTSPCDVLDQDYFVAPIQEWVYGTRFADDPRVVRQFQVLRGSSGYVGVLSDFSILCFLSTHHELKVFTSFSALQGRLSKMYRDTDNFTQVSSTRLKIMIWGAVSHHHKRGID